MSAWGIDRCGRLCSAGRVAGRRGRGGCLLLVVWVAGGVHGSGRLLLLSTTAGTVSTRCHRARPVKMRRQRHWCGLYIRPMHLRLSLLGRGRGKDWRMWVVVFLRCRLLEAVVEGVAAALYAVQAAGQLLKLCWDADRDEGALGKAGAARFGCRTAVDNGSGADCLSQGG